MKLSKPAVITIAVAALIGGGVAADAATTTNPVKLCSNKVIQTVSVPKNGTCPSNANAFYVASQADVAALASRADASDLVDAQQGSRLAALETLISAQAAAIAALKAEVDEVSTRLFVSTAVVGSGASDYQTTVFGQRLKTGTGVFFKDKYPLDFGATLGHVGADGTFNGSIATKCKYLPAYITATASDGSTVRKDIAAVDGCIAAN